MQSQFCSQAFAGVRRRVGTRLGSNLIQSYLILFLGFERRFTFNNLTNWSPLRWSAPPLSVISTLSIPVSLDFFLLRWTPGIHAPNWPDIFELSSNVYVVNPLVLGRRKWQNKPDVMDKQPITPSGTTAWVINSIFMTSGHTATPR